MPVRARLECPSMNALLGLLERPARSAREFMVMCGTTAGQARKTRELLESLRLIRVELNPRGSLTVKRVELTPRGQEVARHLRRADDLIGAPHS
ncbi:MAG TPA: hypothetical protein VNX21_07360 [Candidatus Thermoplasmatota archaeon]|nr:hypothetical protein [Candidatus Thermoplasmatota archaeon]